MSCLFSLGFVGDGKGGEGGIREDANTVTPRGIHGFFRPLYIPDEGKSCSCWSDRIFVILSKEEEKDEDA